MNVFMLEFRGSEEYKVIQSFGQTSTHAPQEVHLSGSIIARKFSILIASYSQVFTHFIHAIQLTLHTLLASAPLSWLLQRTTACSFSVTRRIRFFGHSLTHIVHAVHFSGFTTATPFTICIASYSHTLTQSPNPKQPYWQACVPPDSIDAAAHRECLHSPFSERYV